MELDVVVFALKIWRAYLYGEKVLVFTDHKSLKYIFNEWDLNLRQRRWMELLADYDLRIYQRREYVSGEKVAQKLALLVIDERGVPSGLQGLPIPQWKWDMVTIDFKTDGDEVLAQKYLKEILQLHGQAFQKALGIKEHLNTAYHPQTDRQLKRMIQTLEDMLCCGNSLYVSITKGAVRFLRCFQCFNAAPSYPRTSTCLTPYTVERKELVENRNIVRMVLKDVWEPEAMLKSSHPRMFEDK
ncbi:hypothetical protein N665_1473s0007 [Sinapis alba]|nr:hypothetical protein N665_1473s0007 [Sinapis alba]